MISASKDFGFIKIGVWGVVVPPPPFDAGVCILDGILDRGD